MPPPSSATNETPRTAETLETLETLETVQRWRRDTPGAASRVHLNNAGASLPPQQVLETVLAHLQREAEIGGYEAADEAADRIGAVYADAARLLGARPGEIALVENATVGFSQALASLDFRPGDVIVTSHSDYTSNQIMYLALGKRLGVEVLYAAERPAGGVDPDSLAELAAHPRCRLVALSWVPTNSGLVQDVEEVGEICARRGVPYLVDACQALGQIPIDVSRVRCDFLSATARKFLRGPRGIGLLYVSERVLARGAYPLNVDMRGARLLGPGHFELAATARRFENWEFSYALVLGLGEAVRYALEVGVGVGGKRAFDLAARARGKIGQVPGLRVADRGGRLAAIVTVEVAGRPAGDVVTRLRQAGINTSSALAGFGPPDVAAAGVPTLVRLSPHYYNTLAEVDLAVAALAEIAAGR
ncbi:MAG: aminotransferase class V-fold PLP-dependent enzyme [Acidobacteriota bacterium]|nr:aminotransferase class V-fold PLP-dependent enzyme [Acidobacteriota bacterium]